MASDNDTGPALLPRDLLPTGGSPRYAEIDRAHPGEVGDGLSRLTRGDAVLTRVVALTTAAIVLARSTGRRTVSVLTADPSGLAGGAVPVTVPVVVTEPIARLLVATREALRGVLVGSPADGPAVTDLAVGVDGDLPFETAAAAGATLHLAVRTDDPSTVRLTYRADLFLAGTAERLLDTFGAAVAAAATDVHSPVAAVCGPTSADRDLVAAVNETAAPFPDRAVLHDFLPRQARDRPATLAVLDADLTYADLDRRANQLAHRLRDRGIVRGDVVGICLGRSAEFIVAAHAILRAGAAYLPLDPETPRDRATAMLDRAGCRLVVVDRRTGEAPPPAVERVDVDDATVWAGPVTDPAVPVGPDDLCYVIFTSGSTGRPKGVGVSHRAVVNRIAWMQRAHPLAAGDVILHKTSTSFDVSVWELFWWSFAGAAVACLPNGDERDPARIGAWIDRYGVTTMHFVPAMLHGFTQHLATGGDDTRLGTLRQVFASGEALTAGQVAAFRAEIGKRCDATLTNLYGPTEAAIDVSVQDCTDLPLDRPVPLGRPIDNIRLSVLDPTGAPTPVGVPGELHIAGVGLARGYVNDPALTAAAFVPDPTGTGERMYRTGDLARWRSDGSLEFLGRIDGQVKLRGYRIELGEIEHVAGRVAGVGRCVAFVRGDGDNPTLVLCLVAGGEVDVDEVRARLAAALPAYMVPSSITVVPEIPTTANGKRDLAALTRLVRVAEETRWEAPRTPREQLLAEVWRTALGRDRVGIRDNFFSLGGDSIRFITVLAALRAAGLDLSFQELFAHPTIAELAELVRPYEVEADRATEPFTLLAPADRALLPPEVEDAYPLGALQAGILYDVATGEDDLYHDVATFRVAGGFDEAGFRRALDQVARRHPMLRTSLHTEGFSEPVQLVHRDARPELSVVDLRGRADADWERTVADVARVELGRPMRPGQPDLFRVIVHRREDEFYLHLSYHAAALDGWSVSTVIRDLFRAYLGADDTVEPGAHPGYDRFLALERAAVADEGQRAFWQRLLAGSTPTQLPRIGTGAGVDRPRLVMRDVPLPDGLSAAVVRLAGELRVPVKSVLLAVHVAVLGFVTGTEDVLTGYEHSGRAEEPGGESVAGLFLNTVPVRLRCAGGSWADLVRAAYAAETELLPYRRYPMSRMIQDQRRREPLFEAVFNFTHFHVLRELRDSWGVRLSRTAIFSRTGFPFRAEFWQDGVTDELGLALHHDGRQFDDEQMGRLAGYYVRALELATGTPQADLSARTLMSGSELRFVTAEHQGAVRELPDRTAVDVIVDRAGERPDAVAVSCGADHLDYAALERRSAQVADLLVRSGVRPGDVVAVPMRRGLDWAVAVLGVLRCAAVYLPQEPDDPTERLRAMLTRTRARHVLTSGDLVARLGPLGGGTDEPRIIAVEGAFTDAAARTTPAPRGPRPDDPAYVIFTSGSTGEPKGAVLRHSGMLNHLAAKIEDLGLTAVDRVSQVAPQCFDISVWQLLVAWLVGGRTVVYDDAAVTDLGGFAARLRADRITVAETVPSYLDALLAVAGDAPTPLPDLRWMLVTGEAFPPRLTHRWFARYDVPLVNAYGPTEASDDVTHHVVRGPVDGDRVPVGTPVRNTGIHVTGPDGRLLPVGTFGDVGVTGAGVGLGYVNDPQRTAAVFVPNAYDDLSPVLYRTGDIGRWLPDGTLDVAGRSDHQVKIRGYRVELTEVEAALAAQPGVANPVVVVDRAAERHRLVAFHTGTAAENDRTVLAGLAARLPHYMIPDLVLRLEALPLTANGKVDRRALTGLVPTGQPDARREPPATPAEAELVRVFAEVLDLPVGQVGATDSFFELGGHSLAAMRVAARLGDAGLVAELTHHPDARALAGRLASTRASRPLLVDIASISRSPVAGDDALVYVPFAAGGPISALQIARAAAALPRPARTYAVDLPGRSADDRRAHPGVAALAERAAGALVAEVPGEIMLVGHSAGCALALATALALQRRGRPAGRLVLIGKVLGEYDRTGQADDVLPLSDDEAVDWLVGHTGFAWADVLDESDRREMAVALRMDLVASRAYLAEALREPAAHRLDAPTTVLLAADDPVTAGHTDRAADWRELIADVQIVELDHGGHYLQATRPDAVAAAARGAAGRDRPVPNDSGEDVSTECQSGRR
ncbi:amino acid adenylation domain-containing protein [Micromonospora sp. NPDC005298]|uniref:amino acid adenylation domain-containing protein n=1 Tax=Micromonospora sp. NPDC005298 TaxID=3156873 RepID=UPI0033B3A47E